MLLFPTPAEFRKRRGRAKRVPPPPPAALALVEAEFDDASGWVRLTFDRPIDIAGLDPAQIAVDDGPLTGTLWVGVGSTPNGPNSVVIGLQAVDPTSNAQTVLNAGAGTGIIATGDGGTWAGVSNLVLPFP